MSRRRRFAVFFASAFGVAGLTLIPSASGGSHNDDPNPDKGKGKPTTTTSTSTTVKCKDKPNKPCASQ